LLKFNMHQQNLL